MSVHLGGVYPIRLTGGHLTGGTPIHPDGGYSLPRSGWGYPSQVPHPDLGRGYPPPGPGKGVPPCPDLRRGNPPPIQNRSGPRMGGTPNRNRLACTCYTAGGMPLAFTQEDFLVLTVSLQWDFPISSCRDYVRQPSFSTQQFKAAKFWTEHV